tara:strand:+ start:27008 stop:30967 length:3960 start_codon:yes stop_codon:yes gene_type:complete
MPHWKQRNKSSITSKTTIFGNMAGIINSKRAGVSSFSRANTKNTIPRDSTKGFLYMKKYNMLSKNPVGSGGVRATTPYLGNLSMGGGSLPLHSSNQLDHQTTSHHDHDTYVDHHDDHMTNTLNNKKKVSLIVLTTASKSNDLDAPGYWNEHHQIYERIIQERRDLHKTTFIWLGNKINNINYDDWTIEYGEAYTEESERIQSQINFIGAIRDGHLDQQSPLGKMLQGNGSVWPENPTVIATTANQLNEGVGKGHKGLNDINKKQLGDLAEIDGISLVTYDSTTEISPEAVGFYGIKPLQHISAMLDATLEHVYQKKNWIPEPTISSYNEQFSTIVVSIELNGAILEKHRTVLSYMPNVKTYILTGVTDDNLNQKYNEMASIITDNEINLSQKRLLIIGLTLSCTNFANDFINWYGQQNGKYLTHNMHIVTSDVNNIIKNQMLTGKTVTGADNHIEISYGWDYYTTFVSGISMALHDAYAYSGIDSKRLYNRGNDGAYTTTSTTSTAGGWMCHGSIPYAIDVDGVSKCCVSDPLAGDDCLLDKNIASCTAPEGSGGCSDNTIVSYLRDTCKPPDGVEKKQWKYGVMGYLENWTSMEADHMHPYDVILYSFLTLVKEPDHINVPTIEVGVTDTAGTIYDTKYRKNIFDLDATEKIAISKVMDYCCENHKHFVWAIGGWSDTANTPQYSHQTYIDNFVDNCVRLLKEVGGDGIDFDWEHFSDDLATRDARIKGMADIMIKLKKKLMEDPELANKSIAYTPRYNAFFDVKGDYNLPVKQPRAIQLNTEAEGLQLFKHIRDLGAEKFPGTPYNDPTYVISHGNIMMYDIDARQGFARNVSSGEENPPSFILQDYKDVLESWGPANNNFKKNQIIMGFEAGYQPAGGVAPGKEVSKDAIAYMIEDDYTGGIMFWAANDKQTEILGREADAVAARNKVIQTAVDATGVCDATCNTEAEAAYDAAAYKVNIHLKGDEASNPNWVNASHIAKCAANLALSPNFTCPGLTNWIVPWDPQKRCGTSLSHANNNCNARCIKDEDCTNIGETCHANLSFVPCNTTRCGAPTEVGGSDAYANANTTCGNSCTTNAQCPHGSTCFKDLDANPCMIHRCGSSLEDARKKCGEICVTAGSDLECSVEGETCFLNVGKDLCLGDKSSTDTTTVVADKGPTNWDVRCGASWSEASLKCGKLCVDNGDCPDGENCQGGLDSAGWPCAGAGVDEATALARQEEAKSRCGTDRDNANSKCGDLCVTDADCTITGETCFEGLAVAAGGDACHGGRAVVPSEHPNKDCSKPCDNTSHCRSQWDSCGDTEAFCNDSSIWKAEWC